MHAPPKPISTLARALVATLVVAVLGCTAESQGPQPGSSDDTPALSSAPATGMAAAAPRPPSVRTVTGHVPVGGTTFLVAGDITLAGDAVPGSASFDAAAVWDARSAEEPTAVGGGSYAVTVGGTLYESAAAESLAFVVPDDSTGTDYLVLGAFSLGTDATGGDVGAVVYVIVPAADFAPGATVSLDGVDRIALFGWGPLDAEQPEVAGAAFTGQVTFVSGSLAAGATVTATLAADFAAATWPEPTDPEDPPVGDPVNNVAAGAYALAFSAPADVYCEGSLAGQEPSFAQAPAAVGLADGVVAVAIPAVDQMLLEGAALAGAFGAPSLPLEWLGDPSMPGLFVGWAESGAPGPLGTTRAVVYLALDGESATASTIQGAGGAQYDDRAGGGWCDVQWSATLTATQ
jgi:hypothetical protein